MCVIQNIPNSPLSSFLRKSTGHFFFFFFCLQQSFSLQKQMLTPTQKKGGRSEHCVRERGTRQRLRSDYWPGSKTTWHDALTLSLLIPTGSGTPSVGLTWEQLRGGGSLTSSETEIKAFPVTLQYRVIAVSNKPEGKPFDRSHLCSAKPVCQKDVDSS